MYNAPFNRGLDLKVIRKVRSRRRRSNVILVLTSEGGDAAAAYRISRVFQDFYDKFTVFVPGWCKSAGTLCALGAHELVVSDYGELGPLDVQLRRRDEIGEYGSGLDVTETLRQVREQTFQAFEAYMLQIINRSTNAVSFKLAAELAAKMAVQLYEPVSRQIDPIQVGEQARAMTVATSYGERLQLGGQNVKPGMLSVLIESYPSHDFMIDRQEAESLFERVRAPTDLEQKLADSMGAEALFPGQEPLVNYICSQKEVSHEQVQVEPKNTSAGPKQRTKRAPNGSAAHDEEPAGKAVEGRSNEVVPAP
ncbi:hypothetical protein P3W24_03850 [Luteibacter sp. PPL201]|uniref:SppA protein n=1 Tax=Luteibacter sahnii TaxID=3021977 RepID=A0ABT6B824_9GAMM